MQHSRIAIIGAPLDLGQGRRGGVDDLGNVPVDQPESLPAGPDRARYLPQVALACKRLATMVDRALTKKKMPLVLGGVR